MIAFIVSFLVLLNPFALFVYTIPLYKEHKLGTYFRILAAASAISYLIYAAFTVFGQRIFEVLQVDFEVFRIFGGIVLVSFALRFILQGKKSMITTRGEIGKIASEVALPFIVGAGTITQSILIGEARSALRGSLIIAAVMIINFVIVSSLMITRDKMADRFVVAFDKNAEIILRINGFIVGAYGVDLIVVGIKNIIG
jgi:multiple antibiotic resistance protein